MNKNESESQLFYLLSRKLIDLLEITELIKYVSKEFNIHIYFYEFPSEANSLYGGYNIFMNSELTKYDMWRIYCQLLSNITDQTNNVISERRIKKIKRQIIVLSKSNL